MKAPKGFDPEEWARFEQAVRCAVSCGPITYKQLRESGIIGRKYPYDQVVNAIDALPEEEITEKNINHIIHDGYMWSGKIVGVKKLAKMVKHPKAKEIILKY